MLTLTFKKGEIDMTVIKTGRMALDKDGQMTEVVKIQGKSTDTKPDNVAETSSFFEIDTLDVKFFDAETASWLPESNNA